MSRVAPAAQRHRCDGLDQQGAAPGLTGRGAWVVLEQPDRVALGVDEVGRPANAWNRRLVLDDASARVADAVERIVDGLDRGDQYGALVQRVETEKGAVRA